jgi:hypothetical protein
MTEGVVDVFEVVYVHEKSAGCHVVTPTTSEHLFCAVKDEGPIGEPGERVVQRLVPQLASQVTLSLLGLLEFGDVDEYGADPDDLPLYADWVKALQPKVEPARVLRCLGGNFHVEHGLAAGQDVSVGGLELWPELRDDLGHRPAEVVLHRDAVDRRGLFVDSHEAKVGIDEGEPDGGGGLQRVEDAKGLSGLLLCLVHRLCQSRLLGTVMGYRRDPDDRAIRPEDR